MSVSSQLYVLSSLEFFQKSPRNNYIGDCVGCIASVDGVRETGNRTTIHQSYRLKLYLIYYPCSLS